MTPKEKKLLKNVEKASKIVLKEDAKLFKELNKKDSEPKSVNLIKHWMCQKCGFEIKHSSKPICCSCGGKNSFVELEEPPSHSEKQMDKFTERLIARGGVMEAHSPHEAKVGKFKSSPRDNPLEKQTPICRKDNRANGSINGNKTPETNNFDRKKSPGILDWRLIPIQKTNGDYNTIVKSDLSSEISQQTKPVNGSHDISEDSQPKPVTKQECSPVRSQTAYNSIQQDKTADTLSILKHDMDIKCFCPDCQMSRKVFTTSMNRKVCYDAGYQAGLVTAKLNEPDRHEIDRLRFLLGHAEKLIELTSKSHSNLWNMAYDEGYQDGKRNMEHRKWMEEGEK